MLIDGDHSLIQDPNDSQIINQSLYEEQAMQEKEGQQAQPQFKIIPSEKNKGDKKSISSSSSNQQTVIEVL